MNLTSMGLGARAIAALTSVALQNSDEIVRHTEASLMALLDDVDVLEEVKSALELSDLQLATTEPADEPAHPYLTREEVSEVRKSAMKELEDERRKKAKDELKKTVKQRLKEEMGMNVGGAADEIVSVTLNLAEHSTCITLNTTRYYHGFSYKVPRHVASTLMEMQARGWRHQDEIDGKNLTQHYQRGRDTTLSPVRGISNMPQAAA